MMTKLYILSKVLTFPGAYLRGFWEHLTCKLLGLPVEIPGYLRIDEACGHVEHALAKKGFAAYLIATGPGFMNFMTGFSLFFAGFLNIRYMGIRPSDSIGLFVLYLLMMYVGVSLLCNLFPLVEDAVNLNDLLYRQKKGNIIGRILAVIPSFITLIGAYAEKYAITFILWVVFMVISFAL